MAPPRSRFTYVLMHGTKPIYVLARAIPPHLSTLSKIALENEMSVFLETDILSEKLEANGRLKFTWLKDTHRDPYYLIVVKLNKKEITTFRVFCDVKYNMVDFSS